MSETSTFAGAGRIAQQFDTLRSEGKKALVTFVTAGDPGQEFTVPAMHSLVAGGANVLELGIPFLIPKRRARQFRQPISVLWQMA